MTDQPKDGGPAFPQLQSTGLVSVQMDGSAVIDKESKGGMSLRDWFAGQADVSSALHLLGKEDCEALIGKPMPEDFIGMIHWHFDVIAKVRLIAADAMLAARGQA